MFLALGGHLAFIRALATSFTVLPITVMPQLHARWFAAAKQATAITSKAITLGFQIASPVILAIFLVDLSFGCIGKVASQIKISNDSNTAKSWLGLGLFFLAGGILLGQLPPFFAAMLAQISRLTRTLQ
jgi:flagellar biosynthesis protein FliR